MSDIQHFKIYISPYRFADILNAVPKLDGYAMKGGKMATTNGDRIF
jgi:hypothetical protein